MRRCQVCNISAGVSVPSFAIKPGMSFYAGLRERGEHILEYVFWGVFRSLLWHVPFTINSTLFSYPLRVNGMGGVHPPPMPPGIALKTAAARYAPLRLHLADRAGLPPLSRPALWPPYREVTSCRPRTARRRRRRYRVATIFLSQCRRNRPWAVHLQRRKQQYAGLMVNGIFRRSGDNNRWRQPPFTGIALACDKQKKCGSPFSDPH